MKELSIEDKAKRYDEAIERAKKLYEQGTITESLSYVFPELKKSEDERIRESLLEYLHTLPNHYAHSGVCAPEWIAWLEKQGNKEIDCSQNHQDSSHPNGCIVLEDFNDGEGFYKVHLDYLNKKQVEEVEEIIRVWNKELKTSNENIKDCIGMCLTDVDEQRFRDYNTNLRDCLAWLEKQGEQKPNNQFTQKQADILDKHIDKFLEQKSTDKVEQKFKVDDWIVFNGLILHVDEVVNGYYRTTSIGNAIHNSYERDIDNIARLWTIQDAKDGDVLVCEDFGYTSVMLFESFSNSRISLHCWYNGQTNNFHINTDVALRKDANIHPATKEQRDLLFQKMKESGYKRDAEKKELSKIKQKPADKKGMNLVEEEMTPFQKKVFCIIDTTIEEEQGLKQVCDELLALASNEIEQKPAWSEEDERIYQSIMDDTVQENQLNGKQTDWLRDIKHRYFPQPKQEWSEEDKRMCRGLHNLIYSAPYCDSRKELSDWLKSLKDRVQLQPKQEWKQKNTNDLTDFDNAMMHIGGSFFGENAGLDPNDTNAIKEQANLLLELVPSKEWSEEDEKCIRLSTDIIDSALRAGFCVQLDRDRCVDWLKSLRPQNHWKPSVEQIGVIEAVINNRSFQRRHLDSLYEQLKKLRG